MSMNWTEIVQTGTALRRNVERMFFTGVSSPFSQTDKLLRTWDAFGELMNTVQNMSDTSTAEYVFSSAFYLDQFFRAREWIGHMEWCMCHPCHCRGYRRGTPVSHSLAKAVISSDDSASGVVACQPSVGRGGCTPQ